MFLPTYFKLQIYGYANKKKSKDYKIHPAFDGSNYSYFAGCVYSGYFQ